MEVAHGFFERRRPLDLKRRPSGGSKHTLAEYKNVPAIIAVLISRKMATLHELQTVYGLEDVYDMLEIITIDDYNVKPG